MKFHLQEKTRKRLHFHGTNRDTLLSFINAKALPMEFGGELEMPNESIGQGVCDYFCWFEKDFEGTLQLVTFQFLFHILEYPPSVEINCMLVYYSAIRIHIHIGRSCNLVYKF